MQRSNIELIYMRKSADSKFDRHLSVTRNAVFPLSTCAPKIARKGSGFNLGLHAYEIERLSSFLTPL